MSTTTFAAGRMGQLATHEGRLRAELRRAVREGARATARGRFTLEHAAAIVRADLAVQHFEAKVEEWENDYREEA